MGHSQAEKALSRERILAQASRQIRDGGLASVSVGALMKSVGLTHGGFYGHFDSKEALMAEAVAHAQARSRELWTKRAAASPGDELATLAKMYLTPRHRDDPGGGCVVAALATDAARQGPDVRRVLADGLRASFDFLSGLVAAASAAARRRKAIATYASWVGALVLARAAADDAALSREILEAVAKESGEL